MVDDSFVKKLYYNDTNMLFILIPMNRHIFSHTDNFSTRTKYVLQQKYYGFLT